MASPITTTSTLAEGQLVEIMSALENAQEPDQFNFRLSVNPAQNTITGSFTLPCVQSTAGDQLAFTVQEVIAPSGSPD